MTSAQEAIDQFTGGNLVAAWNPWIIPCYADQHCGLGNLQHRVLSKAPQWKSERAHMLFPSAPETPEAVWHQVEQTCPIARRAQEAPLDTKHFVVDFFLQKSS